ncbi:MAG TPA: hypothetical protein VHN80_31385, partial [Kineosporiaceae bacterium]|nr:hypothetical protein [Kineosporiaceae bacterium]
MNAPAKGNTAVEGFTASREQFESVIGFLDGTEAGSLSQPLAQGELQVLDLPGTSSVAHTTPPVARARHHGDAGTGDSQRLHAELGEPPGLPAAPGGA